MYLSKHVSIYPHAQVQIWASVINKETRSNGVWLDEYVLLWFVNSRILGATSSWWLKKMKFRIKKFLWIEVDEWVIINNNLNVILEINFNLQLKNINTMWTNCFCQITNMISLNYEKRDKRSIKRETKKVEILKIT